MATTFACGYECGLIEHHGGSTSGAPTVVAGGAFGSNVLQCAPAGAALWSKTAVSGPLSAVTAVHKFRFRFPTALPAANVSELVVWFTPGNDMALGFVQSTGKIELRLRQNAVGTGQSSPVIVVGQWYLLEFSFNVPITTWTGDWRIDGVAQTQFSVGGQVAQTFDSYAFGTSTTDTYTAQYDDSVTSNTAGDYPIGDGYIRGFSPTRDGTHNTGAAGNFTNAAGTNITNATTDAWTYIDDPVLTTTGDEVEQRLDTTGLLYTEHGFAASGALPLRVQAVAGIRGATASSCTGAIKLNDGGTIVNVFSGAVASASILIKTSHHATKPTGGAWTQAAFDAILVRLGFGTDVTPDIWFTAFMLEVEMGVVALLAGLQQPEPPDLQIAE